jgi:CheY-like chemotaxis protein
MIADSPWKDYQGQASSFSLTIPATFAAVPSVSFPFAGLTTGIDSARFPMSHPRLVLADDHRGTAALLRELLQSEFDVVGQVEDGVALVDAVERLSPDVVVSDISMPHLDGISAASEIIRKCPSTRIVLITVHVDPLLEQRGLEIGVLGYVHKRCAGEELLPAVHAALRGERYVSQLQPAPVPRIR